MYNTYVIHDSLSIKESLKKKYETVEGNIANKVEGITK